MQHAWDRREVNTKLLRESEGKRPLGKPIDRCIWEDIIKVDLKEIGYEDIDCLRLSHDKDQWHVVVNAITKFRVP